MLTVKLMYVIPWRYMSIKRKRKDENTNALSIDQLWCTLRPGLDRTTEENERLELLMLLSLMASTVKGEKKDDRKFPFWCVL